MTKTEKYTAISLGWGVQSFALAAMVALGELPPVDVAIHADTLHERHDTYEFAKRWTPWLAEHGVMVATVINRMGGIYEVLKKPGQTHVPLFTLSDRGKCGQLKRSCTNRWKIESIRGYLQAHRQKRSVEQWIGISLDEWKRMKGSNVKYVTHCWPLIDRKMTRNDCALWLERHGLEVPPKSSCVFCPYHETSAWIELRNSSNGDWQKAVEVDHAVRKVRRLKNIPVDLFVHPARIPLEEVDLRTEQQKGQLSLWDAECYGICGV